MKIDPIDNIFKKEFKSAYLVINKEPRRNVCLIRHDNTRTTISYARYLMTVKLNRYLNKDEHVDHIDQNKLNDVISNLEIVSIAENNRRDRLHRKIKLADPITLVCPICNKHFTRPSRNLKHKLEKGKIVTCSKKCGGKQSHITLSKKIYNEFQN